MNDPGIMFDRMPRRVFLEIAGQALLLGATLGFTEVGALAEESTPTTTGEVIREHLFEVSLPKSTFPGEAYYTGILTCTLPPGFDGTLNITDQIAQVIISLEGEFTFDRCGAAQVFLADGAVEWCGPEGNVVLGPGDTRLILDLSRPQHILNLGSVPCKMLYSPTGYRTPYWNTAGDITNYIAMNTLYDHDWINHGLSGQSLNLRYDRFTLDPGSSIVIPRDRYPVVRLAERGQIESVVTRTDGTVSDPDWFWGGAFPLLMSERMASSTWTNVSNQPMEIFEYHVQPISKEIETTSDRVGRVNSSSG